MSQRDSKDTQIINDIIYEDYPYKNGERNDKELNKGIISLARRHKFYLPNIQGILGGQTSFFNLRRQAYQICVAKKKNATNSNYKVVGFIIYDYHGAGGWTSKGSFNLSSLEYWLVDKKFQGQGIGRTLYERFERDCQEGMGYNFKVMFDSTDARLCDLYTKLGYKLIKKYEGTEVKNDYGKHIIWFKINVAVFDYPERFGGRIVVYESEVAD